MEEKGAMLDITLTQKKACVKDTDIDSVLHILNISIVTIK